MINSLATGMFIILIILIIAIQSYDRQFEINTYLLTYFSAAFSPYMHLKGCVVQR